MSKKNNKYDYVYVVQGNYGYGWDDLTESTSLREAKVDAKAYRVNGDLSIRVIHRRVLRGEA
jgi:hypothetical protein